MSRLPGLEDHDYVWTFCRAGESPSGRSAFVEKENKRFVGPWARFRQEMFDSEAEAWRRSVEDAESDVRKAEAELKSARAALGRRKRRLAEAEKRCGETQKAG